ncbi:CMGC/CDK protein kinase [Edhazardia aedis USNM 41457]|uniref:CMGC/CDK protein kinase n=1 Tax=Edhazardia aedis (strain USNM 41457) TaxID=1003232 RepID=J9DRJ4_EDHAE|nr:CMGC/CDK protein kinase [Edhazardia aedis USNM 41457]|eukprot:EJW03952.1 CMGC/CDK protein kinase [Edhazardia aedis USNM 41457]
MMFFYQTKNKKSSPFSPETILDNTMSDSKLGSYVKTKFLGSGAYSNVYEAVDGKGNIVAIKTCPIISCDGIPGTSLREIALLKEMDHPHILKVLDVILTEDSINLVFEYFEFDMKRFLLNYQVDVLPLIYQLFLAIEYIHNKNIIHRDLKPQNILISRTGRLKVADFGLARSIDIEMPRYSPDVVTLWYRSPELLKCCTKYNKYIDMWSVGCILVEMITGIVMFCGRTTEEQINIIMESHRRGIRLCVLQKCGSIPEFLSDIICGCLDINVNSRYTATHCLDILSKHLNNE